MDYQERNKFTSVGAVSGGVPSAVRDTSELDSLINSLLSEQRRIIAVLEGTLQRLNGYAEPKCSTNAPIDPSALIDRVRQVSGLSSQASDLANSLSNLI